MIRSARIVLKTTSLQNIRKAFVNPQDYKICPRLIRYFVHRMSFWGALALSMLILSNRGWPDSCVLHFYNDLAMQFGLDTYQKVHLKRGVVYLWLEHEHQALFEMLIKKSSYKYFSSREEYIYQCCCYDVSVHALSSLYSRIKCVTLISPSFAGYCFFYLSIQQPSWLRYFPHQCAL